jgi:hypothetical protein
MAGEDGTFDRIQRALNDGEIDNNILNAWKVDADPSIPWEQRANQVESRHIKYAADLAKDDLAKLVELQRAAKADSAVENECLSKLCKQWREFVEQTDTVLGWSGNRSRGTQNETINTLLKAVRDYEEQFPNTTPGESQWPKNLKRHQQATK